MKLPSLQFYPGDWMKDPNLRRCSRAARGMWIDILCLMFECEDRGVLSTGGTPWTDEEIAAATSGDISEGLSCISELLRKGVAHRNQSGAIFSKRMVRDEHKRSETRKRVEKHRHGNAASNADVTPLSSSSTSVTPNGDGKPSESFWNIGENLLVSAGWTKKNAHSFIGKQIKDFKDESLVAQAITSAAFKKPADPATYIVKTLQGIAKANAPPVGQVTHCPECNSNGMHEVDKDGVRGYAPCPKRKNGTH
jgi:hypothetical protein